MGTSRDKPARRRGTRYWRTRHPQIAASDGVDAAVALSDIARDHPDWADQQVIDRLDWEVAEPARSTAAARTRAQP